MGLTATVRSGVLSVSGEANHSSGNPVEIIAYSGLDPSVQDNGAVSVEVPINGDGSATGTIDARALLAAGVAVRAFASGMKVYGSAQADYVYIHDGGSA